MARNPHRTGEGWAKSAVRAIVRNPRYTGRQVWNKQRKDEILLDVNDVARGYQTRLRWNDTAQWVWSDTIVHQPLVCVEDFEAAQAILAGAGRARQASHETRQRVRNPYALRGRLYCGSCGRKNSRRRWRLRRTAARSAICRVRGVHSFGHALSR